MKKRILSLPPLSHIATMFEEDTWSCLREEFQVWENTSFEPMPADEVASRLRECDAVLTDPDSPPFTRETLQSATNLKIIAHTAGSAKNLLSEALVREVLIPRDIVVFSGNDGLALNVAESTVGLMIAASRRWNEHVAYYRNTRIGSDDLPRNAQFLSGATVGLVSASKVARHVIRLLQPFGCEILVFDPFLTGEEARSLGVSSTGLDELCERSDIISVHAPSLPSTEKLLGAAQFRLMRDGVTFINTSRGAVIDTEALIEECRSGRIIAALDVTRPEPLSADSPLWNLSNVMLTPHLAGEGYAGYFRIGEATFEALHDVFAGRAVAGRVPLDKWDILA